MPAAPSKPSTSPLRRVTALPYSEIWIATAVLFVLSAIFVPKSLSSASLNAMLPFAAILAITAVGQTLIVQQRGIDLSTPGLMTLTAMALATYASRHHAPFVLEVIGVVVIAGAVGLANGLIVAKLSITPLITTLAMNALLLGAMQTYTHGAPQPAPRALQDLAGGDVLGVSTLVWLAAGLVIVVSVVVNHSVIGRRFVATGASFDAVRAAGIRVDRYRIGAYVAGSICFAVAAMLLLGFLETASTTLGDAYLFPSIAAVIVGGTSLAGGRGSVVASAVAALFLSQLVQAALSMGAPTSTQLIVQAAAIAAAAAFRSLRGSRG